MKMQLVLLILLGIPVAHLSAQSSGSSSNVTGVAELTKLVNPTYPPLALQARIMGDVDVMVAIRRDGSVESARLVNGHPMLAVAALESAKRSQFECRECREAVTSYALKYKFQMSSREHPCDSDSYNDQPPVPELDPARHEVAVSGWALQTCDPAVTMHKVRSAKCWYLWRCSTRYGD
jgi:TonB family protein